MKMIKLTLVMLAIVFGSGVQAQDLIQKVPAESQMVVALNGKAFFKHVSEAEVNKIFQNLGFFEAVFGKSESNKVGSIQDFGLDLKSKAYFHAQVTDSVQFIGGVFPLANRSQFEAAMPKSKKVETVNGMKTIYSSDRTKKVAWDDHTLYFLTGIPMYNYFNREDVRARLGLKEDASYDDYDEVAVDSATAVYPEIAPPVMIDTLTEVETVEWEAIEGVKGVYQSEEEEEEEEEELVEYEVGVVAPPTISTDEYDYVDSVLDQDDYQDDYYLRYREVENYNDSIKNALIAGLLEQQLAKIITGGFKSNTSKTLINMKDNELIRVEMNKFSDFYNLYYPMDLIYGTMGARPKMDYGYEGLNASLVVDGHQLKLAGDVSLDKEMSKAYKAIYKNKFNPKFYNFLDPNALGFISLNFSSEAYLSQLPGLIRKVYGDVGQDRVGRIIDLFTTIAEVTLDEKAIGKVMKGDNLFVINGVTKTQVEYTDYEYDDDYNATEVKRSKMETIPQFIWMFTSEDTRIFEKLVAIAITEKAAVDHGGIYSFDVDRKSGIIPYILIDKGIVFVSNDLQKLQDIKANKFQGKGSAEFVKLAKSNSLALVFNAKQVPQLVNDLDIPIHRSMLSTVEELSQYGNFYILSKKMKGNAVPFEVGVDFPKTKNNALSFLVDAINNLTLNLKD